MAPSKVHILIKVINLNHIHNVCIVVYLKRVGICGF